MSFINKFNLFFDASVNWQLGFQNPASPVAEGLIDLHHHIMFFLVLVIVFVYWMIYAIVSEFNEYNFDISKHDPKTNLQNLPWFDIVKTTQFTHGVLIEVIWTLIPTFILLLIAVPSFALLYAMDEIVDPEVTLKVIGHQWYWSYEYSDYIEELDGESIMFDSYMIPDDELELGQFRLLEVDNAVILPTEVHIRVIITAGDVLHCWAVPSLGVKMDAVPGRLNQQNLYIKREGLFFGQCSELCGVNHGFMPIAVKGVPVQEYVDWVLSFEG